MHTNHGTKQPLENINQFSLEVGSILMHSHCLPFEGISLAPSVCVSSVISTCTKRMETTTTLNVHCARVKARQIELFHSIVVMHIILFHTVSYTYRFGISIESKTWAVTLIGGYKRGAKRILLLFLFRINKYGIQYSVWLHWCSSTWLYCTEVIIPFHYVSLQNLLIPV